jgi:DNA polymerase sigma
MKLTTNENVIERAYGTEHKHKALGKPTPSSSVPNSKGADGWASATSVRLDVSFEGPRHNGVASSRYVLGRLAELPATRPLVLALKQCLGERNLSDAYTGGLSSYALFLMVTRYVEEAAPNAGMRRAVL